MQALCFGGSRDGGPPAARAHGGNLAAQGTQLGLEGLRVRRPQAQKDLVACRQRLPLRICQFIAQPGLLGRNRALHLHQPQGQRSLDLGRLQQVVDHRHQPVVEVLAGVAERLVGLLQHGIEAAVQRRRLGDVHAGDPANHGVVARTVAGGDLQAAIGGLLGQHAAPHRIQRPQARRGMTAWQVVDGGHDVVGQPLQGHELEHLGPAQPVTDGLLEACGIRCRAGGIGRDGHRVLRPFGRRRGGHGFWCRGLRRGNGFRCGGRCWCRQCHDVRSLGVLPGVPAACRQGQQQGRGRQRSAAATPGCGWPRGSEVVIRHGLGSSCLRA